VLDCASELVFAGAVVAVGGCGSALGFAATPADPAGVTAGAEFEEELGGAAFAGLGGPVATGVAAAVAELLDEGCDGARFAAEFVAGAELPFEPAAVETEPAGIADPAGVLAEFAGPEALGVALGAGVVAGACVVDFRTRFRKGSP
jgi:hypothetical protein